MPRIVISGGTGFIGSYLSPMLSAEGYDVVHLTRRKNPEGTFRSYLFDTEKGYYEREAFCEGDTIIHLAGASIAGKRWTEERKREIVRSRTETARLLYEATVASGIIPAAFITASGKDIYGTDITENIFTETDPPGNGFMAETCLLWEAAADAFENAGIRVVKIRTSLVMSRKGSALTKLTAPAKAGLIVRLAPGRQYFPWIHIDDLCHVYLKAVNDTSMTGAYNASAPGHITHDMLMHEVARQKKLPVFLPHVPLWVLRAALGEMSIVLTTGSRISPERLIDSGFRFRYPDIVSALGAC